MIVSVGSVRGAPGATSWALLLAAAWPAELDIERVVIEADPAGGVLGARYGLGVDPGIVRFVTSVRRNGSSELRVDEIARRVADDLWVLPAPETPERCRAVWTDNALPIAQRLTGDERVWVVDVGRTDVTNPSLAFIDHAMTSVLVCRSRPEDLVQLPSRIDSLRATSGGSFGVLVAGAGGFAADEVASFAGADQAWVVKEASDVIDEVGQILSGRRGRRSWLWRQALVVGDDVARASLARQRESARDGR